MTAVQRGISLKFLSHLAIGLLACILLWIALRNLSLNELWATLRQLSLSQIALLIVANTIILIGLVTRWHLFLSVQGVSVPFTRLFGYRLAAFGVSYFTPGPQFGGEPLQVYLVTKRHQASRAKAIAAVTLDKLLELLANFTFLLGATLFILQQQLLPTVPSTQAIVAAIGLLAIPCWLLYALWSGRYPISALFSTINQIKYFKRFRLQSLIQSIHQSESQVAIICRHQPSTIGITALLSMLIWAFMVAEFWLMTYLLGFNLSLAQATTVLVAARIAILLPMPAGLGALEASLVLVMGSVGLGVTEGISLTLLIRARDLLLGIAGLYLGSHYSLHTQHPALDSLPSVRIGWDADERG